MPAGRRYNAVVTIRIGIFPGTFDPVHDGHIAFALESLKACRLDEVIFLPEHSPRGKHSVTSLPTRTEQLRQQIAPHPRLRVLELVSRQFTVQDTLPELRQIFAGHNLTLLIGSDIAHTFLYRWEGLEELLSEMSLAIGLRNQDTPDIIKRIIRQLESSHGLAIRHNIISTPHKAVSSSHIRATRNQEAKPEFD